MLKTITALLLLTISANAQTATVNNATVNIIGSTQNVIITQSAVGHSANLQLEGDNISVSVTQSGTTPQSFSLSVTCYSSCPTSPYVVNQY
jgi:hypothetical protein